MKRFEWHYVHAGWYVLRRGGVEVGVGLVRHSRGWSIYCRGYECGRPWQTVRTLREAMQVGKRAPKGFSPSP